LLRQHLWDMGYTMKENTQSQDLNIVVNIPGISINKDIEILKVEETYIKAIRQDGLKVFFDRKSDKISLWLNQIRHNGTKEQVIVAVGLARGLQIAKKYADTYADEIKIDFASFNLPDLKLVD